jgi:ribonuclease BN (tRNA processing enzyme)
VAGVVVSHLHADHFGGIPFLILNAQFARRAAPLAVIGPRGTGRRLAELMEGMFPGSTAVSRRFAVEVTELLPGETGAAAGVAVTAFAADHPSGADSDALSLRLDLGAVIGYTGDTAWTDALPQVAAGADLLIAEAYYRSKKIPYHLRVDDLVEHRSELGSRRIVLTHMSDDVLDHLDEIDFEVARDGLELRV